MSKRMLIDASHAEETRVVMLDGNRLEEYDVETATKKQLKGNIYLAKIVRVEPSLQAAFVEYGGNRHGFLAFGEIHPDYYQIPVADRQRLIAMQEEEAEAERAAEEAAEPQPEPIDQADSASEPAPPAEAALEMTHEPSRSGDDQADTADEQAPPDIEPDSDAPPERPEEPAPETIGGPSASNDQRDDRDDREDRRTSQRLMRHYKIQEVIRRRQVILVQVVKEERGTKGAALTSYISLAGRFCVLMPNSPRGGGVSRKITSATDRKRLKEITAELDIPRGMAMIVRTAGAQRPRPEIKRDCEYLLRLWDDIRDTTLASMAPALIYEEASLIKRAIRDVYSSDVDEILVDGEDGWRAARGFMRTLMPTHAHKVQLWREGQPLFARNNVEGFLDAMMSPSVQLRSGGYLVINQTEALVAIDVNSGRSTRERGIEETAVRTNLEAADEVARQLRLRDLAGLIVIDFIDMESRKNNAMVERRMKDALRQDRARIQVGSISHFGLMEMSRQRLRPSLVENSFIHCDHCNGTGLVRGIESASLHVLRAIEAAGGPRDAAELAVHVPPRVALYILNHKREWLGEIEQRCVMQVSFEADDALRPPAHRIIKTQVRSPADIPVEVQIRPVITEPEPDLETDFAEPAPPETAMRTIPIAGADEAFAETGGEPGETADDAERKRKRRRRRRRGDRKDETLETAPVGDARSNGEGDLSPASFEHHLAPASGEDELVPASSDAAPGPEPAETGPSEQPVLATVEGEPASRSRRGRRSGRRRRRDDAPEVAEPAPDTAQPAYSGPTPADPFNGAFDIFDALEQSQDHYLVNMSASAASAASLDPQPAISDEAPQPEPVLPLESRPAEPEPELEAEPEPAVKPILVGAGEPAARRSGWWKR